MANQSPTHTWTSLLALVPAPTAADAELYAVDLPATDLVERGAKIRSEKILTDLVRIGGQAARRPSKSMNRTDERPAHDESTHCLYSPHPLLGSFPTTACLYTHTACDPKTDCMRPKLDCSSLKLPLFAVSLWEATHAERGAKYFEVPAGPGTICLLWLDRFASANPRCVAATNPSSMRLQRAQLLAFRQSHTSMPIASP